MSSIRRILSSRANGARSRVPVTLAGNSDQLDRMTAAFKNLAAKPSAALLHRYETRLHLMYHRTLQNLLPLRLAIPNEPSPVSEHVGLGFSLQSGPGTVHSVAWETRE